ALSLLDTPAPAIYTLSLHDALPISPCLLDIIFIIGDQGRWGSVAGGARTIHRDPRPPRSPARRSPPCPAPADTSSRVRASVPRRAGGSSQSAPPGWP